MFEKTVETINNIGKAVSEKTKNGTDVVKLSMKIASDEKELASLYQKVGKLYYSKNSENPCCDEMKELFDSIKEKEAAIDEQKATIRVIKGVVVCPNCGADVDAANNSFCGKCGTKIEKPAPVVEEKEEAEIETESEETINIVVDKEDSEEE